MPSVHRFTSSREAYDASQTDDAIKDGDVLVVDGTGRLDATGELSVAVLYEAWPVMVFPDRNALADDNSTQFHGFEGGAEALAEKDNGRYAESVRVAGEEVQRLFCGHNVWPYTANNVCVSRKRHTGNHRDARGREFDETSYIERRA
jgi:hypothetical protein